MPGGNNRGGDIIFNPGLASALQGVSGFRGRFYLGSPADGANVPMYIQRPEITNSDSAGATFVSGQNSTGTAGSLTFLGGDGSTRGGSVYLQPGTSGNKQGRIVFLSEADGSTDLRLVRELDTDSEEIGAGPTWFIGQTATNGDGGDLIIQAGEGASVSNGDLYLSPGASPLTGSTGTIYWGTNDGTPSLNIVRPDTNDSPAHDTIFRGASSTGGNGGDLRLFAGDAAAQSDSFASGAGGDVLILGGQAEEDYGGEVFLQAGSGATGGDITLASGSADENAGDISFTAGGAGRGGIPGSIYFYAPESAVTFQASQVLLDSVPLFYDNNGADDNDQFVITDGALATLTIRANDTTDDEESIFVLDNGAATDEILRDRAIFNVDFRPIFNPQDPDQIVQAAQDVFEAMDRLRTILTTHHNLIATPGP